MSQVEQPVVQDENANVQIGETSTFRGLFARESHTTVTIPIIQRDYAQGREAATEIRSGFLESLFNALSLETGHDSLPLDLDFVYGNIEGEVDAAFCPLDGQQRLTTLFLLHWYLAWQDDSFPDFQSFVREGDKSKFSYSVRPSSGEFFDELVCWYPEEAPDGKFSALVEDQHWFFRWWKRDPTIQSALTMLDAIHKKFGESEGFYERLINTATPHVTFQLLDLKDFGLTDDLYIKMNARGKPLTDFEVFKAGLENRLKETFEDETRELSRVQVPMKEYFSRKIDGVWADLFWNYRNDENLFDDKVMNLVRVMAILTRDPDSDEFFEEIETLRDSTKRFSLPRYTDNGCLDRPHLETLVQVLDDLSGEDGGAKSYLPEKSYFDDAKTFSTILSDGEKATYEKLVSFYAYISFIEHHRDNLDADRLSEWMRVVVNLVVNSNIERIGQFQNCISSLDEMIDDSGDVLTYMANGEDTISPFLAQQVKEERIKARLIQKSEHWKNAIHAAEQHPYFRSQVEFLLDFSGVLAAWEDDSSLAWADEENANYLMRFTSYFDKASPLFDRNGLVDFGEFRTERALLAIGNYLFAHGANSSFLEGPDGPVSWKRLLRGEKLSQSGERRGFFRQLLDQIDVAAGIQGSLDNVIATNVVAMPWRKLLVDDPRLIEYCLKRKIRVITDRDIYLLRGVRRSGEHVDLFSYSLCIGVLSEKFNNGELASFDSPSYNPVATDSEEPFVFINHQALNVRWIIQAVQHGYCFYFQGENDGARTALRQSLEAIPDAATDAEGDFVIPWDNVVLAIENVVGSAVDLE